VTLHKTAHWQGLGGRKAIEFNEFSVVEEGHFEACFEKCAPNEKWAQFTGCTLWGHRGCNERDSPAYAGINRETYVPDIWG